MNKMNPSQIDMYQAAFGGGGEEDIVYASMICKKIQQRAVKKAVTRSFGPKEDLESNKMGEKSKSEMETS